MEAKCDPGDFPVSAGYNVAVDENVFASYQHSFPDALGWKMAVLNPTVKSFSRWMNLICLDVTP